jgi:type IV pilus assembly protein PilA
LPPEKFADVIIGQYSLNDGRATRRCTAAFKEPPLMRRSARGFTLIELMIVVAIIGILAAIAVPNFVKFTARARQSEVKSNLKGFSTAAKSYFAEQATFVCGDCGFQPEQGNRYSYDWGNNAKFARTANTTDTCAPTAATQAQNAFSATGAANIDSDATCDQWNINQNNVMSNPTNDIDS